jgi:hypothetical protein
VGTELFYADGRRDMKKLTVLANAPKLTLDFVFILNKQEVRF